MTDALTATRSLTVEREFSQPPETVWRALTQSPLIGQWLMQGDFQPVVGHRFHCQADWGSVAGRVLVAEPNRTLSYTWGAYGLESVVTWTLTPTGAGTRLHMEHAGFEADQQPAYEGAAQGWPRFLAGLERVLSELA